MVMQFSPVIYYDSPLSKYPFQHLDLKDYQSMFFVHTEFHTHTKQQQI
jgi:hypothetical protein